MEKIHLVSSTESTEFTHLKSALSRSSLIALDAEWKPIRSHPSTFPQVSLLQIACRLQSTESVQAVFLVDLSAISPSSIHQLLKQVFESPRILKLGFRFKQDFVYLSSTFASHASLPGFDRVDPYLDITSIYNILQNTHTGRKIAKQNKSLATICKDLLGVSLSKELQCSDWSCRPLTEDQMHYAAADAFYLLRIFDVFCCKFLQQGNVFSDFQPSYLDLGLKIIFEEPGSFSKLVKTKFCSALEMIQSTIVEVPYKISTAEDVNLSKLSQNTTTMDDTLLQIVRRFGDIIELKESDRKPKASKRTERRQKSIGLKNKEKKIENIDQWEGPPPWDLSLGGDGLPKFLCDVMVEGLAKHLRCVGIDAAVPNLKKPDSRNLIEQAYKEKRVILTRDVKLFRHDYLIRNQIYRVKSLLKNEQLVEVIDAFQLKIREDQLMSRCTKCNGSFIQKPLSTEEAIEAAKGGFQVIPNCLFKKNLEFWQCKDCNQLYWEGTQYHNALQKFIDVCKLN